MISWITSGLVSAGVVAAFVAARDAASRLGNPWLASPVIVASLGVAVALAVTRCPVERFEALASPLRWALGPAIVALGAVVHASRAALRVQGAALVFAVVGGIAAGVASALLLARVLGLGDELAAATLTRTISTPFTILIQGRAGGPVSLAAAFAVITGVIGAIILPPLLNILRLRGSATTGVAMGVAAHLVGTDWIGRRDTKGGAFAGTAMVLGGAIAAVVLPPAWRWLLG
ncbi:MAG: LrgB family protein [Janthinobacterium lividum]